MLSNDHFHMNDQGYDCLAQILAEGLAPLLQTPDATVAATSTTRRETATVAKLAPDRLRQAKAASDAEPAPAVPSNQE